MVKLLFFVWLLKITVNVNRNVFVLLASLKNNGTDALLQMRDILLRYIPGVPELWAISCCCKDLRNHYAHKIYVKYILERNLRGLLRSFGLTMTNLQDILQVQRGSVLSGSAVLQAYIGAFWETSDIDIYIPYKAQRFKAVLDRLMDVIPSCEYATIVPRSKVYLNMSDYAAIVEVERPNGKKTTVPIRDKHR